MQWRPLCNDAHCAMAPSVQWRRAMAPTVQRRPLCNGINFAMAPTVPWRRLCNGAACAMAPTVQLHGLCNGAHCAMAPTVPLHSALAQWVQLCTLPDFCTHAHAQKPMRLPPAPCAPCRLQFEEQYFASLTRSSAMEFQDELKRLGIYEGE